MEEKIIRHLNGWYYGVMVLTLGVLAAMYYLTDRPDFEALNPLEQPAITLQYVAILMAIVLIPFGLYLIKWIKPKTLKVYEQLATCRILMIGSIMPFAISLFYLMGGYRPMMWVAGIAAIGWYFTKPTLGKLEKEMTPEDPNMPTY